MMLNDHLTVFFLSALPLSELRATIPLGIKVYNLGVAETIALAVSGVMLAVFIIFIFIDPAVKILRNIGIFDRFFNWLFSKTRERHDKKMKLWGTLALLLIAVTPFPGTGGGWTSSLVAYLFGLNKVKSIIIIAAGTFVSSLLVLILMEGIWLFF